MQLFQKTRRRLGAYFLKQELKKNRRKSFFYNFENAKTIGILFNATNVENFDLVKKYIKNLKSLDKKTMAVGYYTTKEQPEINYPKAEFELFTFKDLNWHLRPQNTIIENFIKEEFDILIDLNLEEEFPLHYISALSKAKFKIGKHSANFEVYDMMIDTGEEQGLRYFLKHLDHYLMQINNTKLKQTQKI